MRNCIVLLLFVLAGLGGQALLEPEVATHSIGGPRSVALVRPVNWVRTVDGWESFSDIYSQPIPPVPLLHPAVITAGQVLASVFALLAFSPKTAAPKTLASKTAAIEAAGLEAAGTSSRHSGFAT